MEYPKEFLFTMQALLGPEYEDFCKALDEPSLRALRINPLRRDACALVEDYIADTVPWEPNGFYLKGDLRPGKDPAHIGGAYYMQDASAMAPVRALDPRPGERVLDLCAAPGGKSGQIAAALGGQGFLVSNEPEFSRAQALRGNLERLGVVNAWVVSALPQRLSGPWKETFDALLVDAPCSGEGMFRRDEGARKEWTPQRAAGCAQRQREILSEAAKMVAPGGRMVYSTCTFNRGENEENIQWFLENHPDFSPGEFYLEGIGRSEAGCLRLWPHKIKGEGHFVALVIKAGEKKKGKTPAIPRDKGALEAFDRVKKALPGNWTDRFQGWRLTIKEDILSAVPGGLQEIPGVSVLWAGTRLARLGRGYVKPEHALAMALEPRKGECPFQELTDEQALCYLRGETLPAGQEGWALAAWRGLPLGWGKGAGGIFKNHLPKGIRLL